MHCADCLAVFSFPSTPTNCSIQLFACTLVFQPGFVFPPIEPVNANVWFEFIGQYSLEAGISKCLHIESLSCYLCACSVFLHSKLWFIHGQVRVHRPWISKSGQRFLHGFHALLCEHAGS